MTVTNNETPIRTQNIDKAEEYIDRIKDLPPAPTVATELLDLFSDPNSNIVRVVELIQHDPSLTIKILKMANSAYFSGDNPSTDMFEVVTRLGFYDVYCVVAALVGARLMALGKTKNGLDIDILWRHSVISAVAAGKLAKRVEAPEAAAFTAGLLHDIGRLVLASVEGARYAEVVKRTEEVGTSITEAEKAEFGVDHATIGARLLARWGLTGDIAAAALFHNGSPSSGKPFERLVAIVQLASDLARQIEDVDFSASQLLLRRAEAMNLLGLAADDVPDLIAEVQDEVDRVSGLSTLNFDAAI